MPVDDPALRGQLEDMFDCQLRDTAKGRVQRPDGVYVRETGEPCNTQELFCERAYARAQERQAQTRRPRPQESAPAAAEPKTVSPAPEPKTAPAATEPKAASPAPEPKAAPAITEPKAAPTPTAGHRPAARAAPPAAGETGGLLWSVLAKLRGKK